MARQPEADMKSECKYSLFRVSRRWRWLGKKRGMDLAGAGEVSVGRNTDGRLWRTLHVVLRKAGSILRGGDGHGGSGDGIKKTTEIEARDQMGGNYNHPGEWQRVLKIRK